MVEKTELVEEYPEETSPPAPPKARGPLGMPSGSIRAILALSIFGTAMATVISGHDAADNLWLVTYVMLGYYFAGRQVVADGTGKKGQKAPLNLPRGTVRLVLVLGFLATAAYLVYDSSTTETSLLDHEAIFSMVSLGSFFLGRLVRFLGDKLGWKGGGFELFNDLKAFAALGSALVLVLIFAFGVELPMAHSLEQFAVSTAVFYFGSR